MKNNTAALIPNQIIVGEHLYSDAISLILASAQHELLIFDQDLSHGDFNSLQKYTLLQEFLSKNIASRLTIILQDTDFFINKCPRLFNLLTVYDNKMSVHITNSSVKHAKDCFILADKQHYVKRIHIDQARFKYALNDKISVEVLNNRFKEFQEAIQDVVTIKPLGL